MTAKQVRGKQSDKERIWKAELASRRDKQPKCCQTLWAMQWVCAPKSRAGFCCCCQGVSGVEGRVPRTSQSQNCLGWKRPFQRLKSSLLLPFPAALSTVTLPKKASEKGLQLPPRQRSGPPLPCYCYFPLRHSLSVANSGDGDCSQLSPRGHLPLYTARRPRARLTRGRSHCFS